MSEIKKRVDKIEKLIPSVISQTSNSFGKISSQISTITEILDIIGEIVGMDKIKEGLEARQKIRDEHARTQSDNEKKALQTFIDTKVLEPAETIGDRTYVVVGREIDKDGKELPPGRIQRVVGQLPESIYQKVLFQKVGSQIDFGNSTFIIDEILKRGPGFAEFQKNQVKPVASA